MAPVDEPDGRQFGKLLTRPVLAGYFSELARSELAVYLVLAATSHDWTARPSVATIAAASGCGRRTVQLALRKLSRRGLIRPLTSGHGRPTEYILAIEVGRNPQPQGAQPSNTGGAKNPPRGRTLGCAHTEEPEQEQTAGAAAFVEMLTEAGIGEPTRTTLAADLHARGVLAGEVAGTIAATTATGGGPGLVVARLREMKASHVEAKKRDERHASDRAASVARDRAYRDRVHQERDARDTSLAACTPEELEAVAASVAADWPIFAGRNWNTNQGYRSAMVRALSDIHRAPLELRA
tara:strand:- start:380 stop:1264 length:885 start_codon:yes stop_codon:yes gene_type:complete